MEEEYRLKRITPLQLRKKLKTCLIITILGVILVILSLLVGVGLNYDRYGGHGVRAVQVAARVTGSESVFIEEEQDGASMTQERWYLTAEYQYQGETHTIQLDDYFVDKSYVQQYIGETRELYINAETFEKLEQRPFNYLFLVFLTTGLILAVYGRLVRFRYADYKQRLLPARRRVNRKQLLFQMRRGRA